MLLTLIFTFTVGPVLQLDLLLHFLTFVWEKNRGTWSAYIFSFRYMQKLICRTRPD